MSENQMPALMVAAKEEALDLINKLFDPEQIAIKEVTEKIYLHNKNSVEDGGTRYIIKIRFSGCEDDPEKRIYIEDEVYRNHMHGHNQRLQYGLTVAGPDTRSKSD